MKVTKENIEKYREQSPITFSELIRQIKVYLSTSLGFNNEFYSDVRKLVSEKDYIINKHLLFLICDDDKWVFKNLLKCGFTINETFKYISVITEASANSVFTKDQLFFTFKDLYFTYNTTEEKMNITFQHIISAHKTEFDMDKTEFVPTNSDAILAVVEQMKQGNYNPTVVWVDDDIFDEVKHLKNIIEVKKASENKFLYLKKGSFIVQNSN